MTARPNEPPRETGHAEVSPTTSVGWPPPPVHPAGPPVRPPSGARETESESPGSSSAASDSGSGSASGTTAVTQAISRPGPPVTPPSRPAAAASPVRPLTVGPPTATTPARKGGRRARLTVKRIDPWSTLKFSFVYSLAGLIVLLVAVVALYAIVDAMGVIDSIQSFLRDVDQPKSGQGIAAWLSFSRVFTVALVLGGVNVILFTAFATLTAFVYNVCTDLVGGVEVTLAERG